MGGRVHRETPPAQVRDWGGKGEGDIFDRGEERMSRSIQEVEVKVKGRGKKKGPQET